MFLSLRLSMQKLNGDIIFNLAIPFTECTCSFRGFLLSLEMTLRSLKIDAKVYFVSQEQKLAEDPSRFLFRVWQWQLSNHSLFGFIQLCASAPKYWASRNAVSGPIPLRSLTISPIRLAGTRNFKASACADNPVFGRIRVSV